MCVYWVQIILLVEIQEVPLLDAYGRLVGINFDRSWESTMSDAF